MNHRFAAALLPAFAVLILAACGGEWKYLPVGHAFPQKLPLKVEVVAFEDHTAKEAASGLGRQILTGSRKGDETIYNQAKTGLGAPVWAKALADEFQASDAFKHVEFVLDGSQPSDADVIITGQLLQANSVQVQGGGSYREVAAKIMAKRKSGEIVVDKLFRHRKEEPLGGIKGGAAGFNAFHMQYMQEFIAPAAAEIAQALQ